MARVANTLARLAINSLDYINEQINISLINLGDADDLVRKLTNAGNFDEDNITAFKNEKISKAKDANKNALKMYRWLIGELSITIPTAYTNTQVDAIDPEIRTFDDGT